MILLKLIKTRIKSFIDNCDKGNRNFSQNSDDLDLKSRVVYAYQVNKWSTKSISSYFNLEEWRVLEIISKFETIQKRGKEFSSSSRRASRKIMTQHSDAIRKFLDEHKGKHITVDKIKLYLNENNIDLPKISDWSIRRILKTKLKYSYKRIWLINKKMFTANYWRLFFESALALMMLESKCYELLYWDEFSINFRQKSIYGWGPRGNYEFQHNYSEEFNMSFIVGFSINRIYGIMRTTSTHHHKSFITFVNHIIDYRTNKLKLSDSKLIFVCDNSSIHKSKEVKEYLNKNSVNVMTIWPYSPALNPAEKMILYIRQKIKLLRSQGK